MACVSLLFSEVGEGGFREWEGVIIVYRGGGGGAMSRSPQM